MRSDGKKKTQTEAKKNVYGHTLAHIHIHTHTNIDFACKLATVLGFSLLTIQCQAVLHFSRPQQHS